MYIKVSIIGEQMSDCCVMPTQQCGSYIMARTSLFSMEWWWGPLCTRPTHLVGFFIVLAHWNNSPRVDMSLHSDTLSWFRANQSAFQLICVLSGKATNTNCIVSGLTRSNPLSTTLKATLHRRCDLYNWYPFMSKKLMLQGIKKQRCFSVFFPLIADVLCASIKYYIIYFR